jgi:hypothetical protein
MLAYVHEGQGLGSWTPGYSNVFEYCECDLAWDGRGVSMTVEAPREP